ncbi:hypothetical protein [Psychrobacillus lasiicapitis]|uniref:Group-specific protein n=1 Tax=Psychrobacillus lasiicapitis TaxID=1636719 RepID=A0A544T4U1_9BACI|nr:hypothetical protein [Psychrobacillus lasiicapitis]TQR12465.1 hypothetical protein FG382_12620 [Psychrobacillus lasiicapitis]GGA38329.1 hypothetical protein GCM10011384_29840 [Psychrobacillus lasiicapitis]
MESIQHLDITDAFMNYLFPFSFREKEREKLMEQLKKHNFKLFDLDNYELQDLYYGKGIQINHQELDQFFLPFIEDKLFPHSVNARGFLRYSREIKESFALKGNNNEFKFTVNSLDIILCPFGIGIITIRTEMIKGLESLTNVLDFMSHFRVLEPKLEEERGTKIYLHNKTFTTTSELILDYLCPFLKSFIVKNKKMAGYYGSLPFFEDERMLSQAFLIADGGQLITNDQLFRMGQLDGRDPEGNEFISSTNPEYINRYVEERIHDRWAPNTYTITSLHTQTTISVKIKESLKKEIAQFMSIHYYNLLLHFYYKIMLLRLSFEHSEISWEKDKQYVEELIELISKFDSHYYFEEISVRSEGKELTNMLREAFYLKPLFVEVKRTVDDLYRAQEKQAGKRQNMLLFILTVYTVVSGIYGMNLVIEDWKEDFNWSSVFNYTFFEWITLVTALSGIALSTTLLISTSGKGIRDKYRKWKREHFK